jgi:hypothetical protein
MTSDSKTGNRSTDLWIESHQQLGKHPKMLRAARLLGINRVQMVGHLQYLWWWALDFATAGDIADYDAADIADAALWNGDPELFYSALVQCGWIDKESDQGVVLHDWHDYAGKLLEGREKAAEKMRRYREKQRGYGNVAEPDSAPINKEEARNGNVTVTSPPRNSLTNTVTVTTTTTEDDLRGEPVLEPPAREPETAAAAKPPPRATTLRSVPKTATPDRNDLAWLEQEVRERAVKAGFDPPTLLAEIDVGDQTNRWHDFEPAAGKGKITWRNWMRLEIDKQLATLKGARNGSMTNGKHNGHQSARERQDQSALAAIQFFGAPPPAGGVPDQDPPAGGPGIPGRSDGGRAGFVDVTPRYLGDRPG